MSERVTLIVAGTELTGWQEVRVRRALDEVAGSFELALAEPWTGRNAPVPLIPFQEIELLLDGERVLRGITDSAEPAYDATTHETAVAGRSRTGQLVDCAALHPGSAFANAGLAEIAGTLASPYGIAVRDAAPEARTPFARVAIEPGESVHEVLDRLARQRGVWLTDDASGALVVTRRGTDLQGALKGPLNVSESGVRVLAAQASLDGSAQHSDYVVKGQHEGGDLWAPARPTAPEGRARDASVPLHRPLVILSETQGDGVSLRDRAVFEAALRRGQARRVTYTLPGWHRPDGGLWEVNRNVMVRDTALGLDGQMLVVAVAFTRSAARGTLVELTCAEPEAFDLLAIPEVKKESVLWRMPQPACAAG